MKVRWILVALVVGVLSMGCNLREVYKGLKADYVVLKDVVAAQCALGEISEARCEMLANANNRLERLDAIVRQGDSSRAEVKEALEQLEAVVEQQKDALAGL